MPDIYLTQDIEWKFYDGTDLSKRKIAEWFFDLATHGEFRFHPNENNKLVIRPGCAVVLTPLGLQVRY